jgi:hypothetical protein
MEARKLMANHSRRDRISEKLGKQFSQLDNEIQMLVDTHNTHDSGLVGWTALSLLDGSNKRMGQVALSGGTATVSNTSVTANTRIFLSHANTSGTLGHLYISARVAGTSFTITSSSGTDTSTVNWLLIEPK